MRRLVVFGVAFALVFAAPATILSRAAGESPSADDRAPAEAAGIVTQSTEDALAQDLGLIAEARGWSLDEAAAYHRTEQAIGRVAVKVAAERPDAFVGSALSLEPEGAPTLYVKGAADKFIDDLVKTAGVEIVVAENQSFSLTELEDRQLRVHRALEAQGFRFVVTAADITRGGAIKATVTRESETATAVDVILSRVPADLRSSTELTIQDAPTVVDEAAFGGMWVRDNGANECTSGWTVQRVGAATRGISSAAHCTGIDQVNHPGHGLHAVVFQNEHAGQWGDVEWYTTPEPEPDDFYADAVNVRDVQAVEPRAAIAVNESVCAYGRSSNDRDCTLEVLNPSIVCGALNRIVQMNGDTQIGGDSGGGWSFNFTAFGGHFGNCGGLDSFTAADLFDEALGVFVPIT